MRLAIIGGVLVLAGAAFGYYMGYDHGFEDFLPKTEQTAQTEEATTEKEAAQIQKTYTTYTTNAFSISHRNDAHGYYVLEPEVSPETIVLVNKKDFDAVETAGATEGPPTITISVYANPKKLSAIEWIETDSRSNFGLGDQTYEGFKLDGEFGVLYSWSGLYEGESVVVTHNNDIYMLSVTYFDPSDQIVEDFNELLDSFTFAN